MKPQKNKLTKEELIKKTGLNYSTLNTYLCRAEFAHIKTYRENGKKVFENIYDFDLEKIKSLILARKGSIAKLKRNKKNGYAKNNK